MMMNFGSVFGICTLLMTLFVKQGNITLQSLKQTIRYMNTHRDTKKEPILQYIILCEAIGKSQGNNKLAYINEFNSLPRPSILPQFFIALKWICGVGPHIFSLKVLDPNLKVTKDFGDTESPESRFHSTEYTLSTT